MQRNHDKYSKKKGHKGFHLAKKKTIACQCKTENNNDIDWYRLKASNFNHPIVIDLHWSPHNICVLKIRAVCMASSPSHTEWVEIQLVWNVDWIHLAIEGQKFKQQHLYVCFPSAFIFQSTKSGTPKITYHGHNPMHLLGDRAVLDSEQPKFGRKRTRATKYWNNWNYTIGVKTDIHRTENETNTFAALQTVDSKSPKNFIAKHFIRMAIGYSFRYSEI